MWLPSQLVGKIVLLEEDLRLRARPRQIEENKITRGFESQDQICRSYVRQNVEIASEAPRSGERSYLFKNDALGKNVENQWKADNHCGR